MRLEIQTSTLPHRVLSALVNFTDDESHRDNWGCQNEWISGTLHPWSSAAWSPFIFRNFLTLLFLFAFTCQRRRRIISLEEIHSLGEDSLGNLSFFLAGRKTSPVRVWEIQFRGEFCVWAFELPCQWQERIMRRAPGWRRRLCLAGYAERQNNTAKQKTKTAPPWPKGTPYSWHFRELITGSAQPKGWVNMAISPYFIWAQFTWPQDLADDSAWLFFIKYNSSYYIGSPCCSPGTVPPHFNLTKLKQMPRGHGDQDWYNKIWSQFPSLNQYLTVSLLLFIYFLAGFYWQISL